MRKISNSFIVCHKSEMCALYICTNCGIKGANDDPRGSQHRSRRHRFGSGPAFCGELTALGFDFVNGLHD